MRVFLNKITGVEDAIISMFMSKRTWTPELNQKIIDVCDECLDRDGRYFPANASDESVSLFEGWMSSLIRFGRKHITMLRFIDFSVTVEGLHRGGQDDWDSHAKRFDNRIIRSSTRLATFDNEMSSYYEDKIVPTDIALAALGIVTPDKIVYEGKTYVKAVNGYILEEFKDSKDVKRGLYMLSIPSNFIFKCNVTEYAHVYKERNEDGSANPEVKELCEEIVDKIEFRFPWVNRELLDGIEN